MDIAFVPPSSAPGGALAVIVFEDEAGGAGGFGGGTREALGRVLATSRFRGARGQTLELLAPAGGEAERVLLVGAGPRAKFDAAALRLAAAQAYQAVKLSGAARLTLRLGDATAQQAAEAAYAVRLAAYRFDRYRTREKPDAKPSIKAVAVETNAVEGSRAAFAPLAAVADGVTFTRDLVSEPANVLSPPEFAERLRALKSLGVEVEVLGEAEMAALGMNSLLAVGHGSVHESQLVILRWNGAEHSDAPPVAFVGKGVCFDTGGISIKPAEGMEDMKWDMGGAGAVAGLMHALAGRKAKVNAIGVVGLVENMPDGQAMRPGDVVTSMSGQTIEIINTDAEGRLVLADALWYCQDRFKPRFMVDLATLTGAIIISLGHDYAGLFSNDDPLSEALLAAGEAEGEGLWRMPLPAAYERQIESPIADMKNIGGRPGGSITAALFLQRFVNGLPWAHLDIASTAWRKPSTSPLQPEGATGFGVRLLNRLVADNFED